MEKKHIYIAILVFHWFAMLAAQEADTPTIVDWRQHNLTKYNRMLVHPAYSVVGEEGTAISFWSRIQWTGVNNSPQTFLLNYSGKVGASSGAGIGLYQQNLGLLTDSGMLMNYAYRARFSEHTYLSFGINSALFRRGLNKNAVSSSEPDPAILENQDDFLWIFMPGINLSIGGVDIGVYAENLFDYNLNESRSVTGFDHKIYSAQLGYTHEFKNAIGLLDGAKWRSLSYAKTQPNNQPQYGGSTLLDLPRYGWLQMGYNNVYGINGALGVKLGDGISVGVIFETGTNLSNRNFGPTYEAMATVELGGRRNRNSRNGLAAYAPKKGTQKVANQADQQNPEGDHSKAEDIPVTPGAPLKRVYAVFGATTKETQKQDTPMVGRPVSVENTGEEIAIKKKEDQNQDLERIVAEVLKDEITTPAETTGSTKKSKPLPSLTGSGHQEMLSPKSETDVHPDAEKTVVAATSVIREKAVPADNDSVQEDVAEAESEALVTRKVFGETTSYRTLKAATGVEKGFYLVVNVFSREHYFKDFTSELREKGFEPLYFKNPDNDFWYVYLAYADNYYRVKQLQRSHLDGQYKQDKWVLWVK
ncbi:PorP/SprF family type IX secretion system membrane protein [Robertkochia flava]|uniref:PorP/SprF family type IX secretion system membrane protein n=1 Tax=Robertkochia flava TaxID=3447986 RepID=UPI001CD029A8|nr:PorP/SprF family type IX secretion system membrane protein [Robertkochia marina]